MAILSESEARALLEKTLAFSKADECQVTLSGGRNGNLRFARNTVSTSGGSDQLSLVVQSSIGPKSGTATINEFDAESLARVVRNAEELARLSPVNPEYVPQLGAQSYVEPKAYFESTARLTQEDRVKAASASIGVCKSRKLTAAGYLSDRTGFASIANSKGLFGYQRRTELDFTITTRTSDERGSGYALADLNDSAGLDATSITNVAAQKAEMSQEPRAIEPGKYTVILEPVAGAELVRLMLPAMSARLADEGRSFLSKPGGATRLGEKIVDERVQLFTDPLHPERPGAKWIDGGRPLRRVDWIKNGVVQNVGYTRFWAQKKGIHEDKAPPTLASGLIMAGTDNSLETLIKSVKRGVLVTRLWYIRAVDPQTLLYTGLTRDGTFFVENGEIKYPIKNFRFNESPVIMLNNLEALGKPVRVSNSLVPPMVLRDFTFSSLSDAV